MAALTANEKQKKKRLRSLAKGLVVGALAVGVPALLLRRSTRKAGPLPPADWGDNLIYRWRGLDISYQRLGAGPTIVALHSLGPGHDGSQWRRAAECLAERFEILTPDLPGWGHSASALIRSSGELYVDFVFDFLSDAVGQPAVVVASHRSAAFLLAANARDDIGVRAIGLVSPRGLGADRATPRPADRLIRQLIRTPVVGASAIETYLTHSALERHLKQDVYGAPDRVDDALVERHWVSSHQHAAIPALEALLAGDLDLDVRGTLEAVDVPVWLAWGRRAKAPPVEAADLWLQRLPHAHLDVFDECGLLPHAEAPEAFCRRLEAFLTTLGA